MTFKFNQTLVGTFAACFSLLAAAQEAPGSHAPTEAAGSHAPAANWNDTFVGARYATDFHFPGSDAKVTQAIGTLTTTGASRLGNYFFNVDYLVSDHNNPESGGTHGAQEVYSVGHFEWTAGKVLGAPISFGPVRDLGLTTGYEFGAKDDAFQQRARMAVLGLTADFAVPHGYWNLTLGARTEKNYNGIVHKDVNYDTAWHVDSAWMLPFNAASASLVFKGFVAITGPKGLDGFHQETKTETLARTALMLDAGALTGHPRSVYVGLGYEYWHNMFGTSAAEAAGTHRSAPVLQGEIHF